jgi:cytochrome c-type biogenesis protein CcmI
LEIFAILIGLLILAAIAFYVSRPLMQSQRAAKSGGADALSLEAQRESLYTQVRELDLDHATGKVNDEDYARLRADLVAQAAAVLKQLDGVVQQPSPAAVPAVQDDLEALIAARRKAQSTSAPKAVDSDVEAAIAARRKSATPAASELTCPQCGKPIGSDDAFCAKCGAALQPQVAH